METSKLRKFAQYARRTLIEQVSTKMRMVLADDSLDRRESSKAVAELEKQIKESSKEQVIEKISYIWFNRFCALRYMDVNRFNQVRVVSTAEGQFQPEILADAKMGHIDENIVPDKISNRVFALLNGNAPSNDPQAEAYRLLVVAICNEYSRLMPFLFSRIFDYTELLMPDDLLSSNSILAYTREAMTPDICEDVEVIGWLYQFYISEKKDEVFTSLKKGKKIVPENIPAATQLFTPHWIVRFLVENSLGRLWMLNRPNSRLRERMDYYIEHEQPETDFLKISSPEELKICDPACGSGHMLTYAFDLLYFIYEEEGYDPPDIPRLILKKNLYGIEIDGRAGELAAFALVMKARKKYRRFFSKPVQPQICVLENIVFKDNELKTYMDEIGRDLFTINLQETLHQFREADNFGSLIRPALTDVEHIRRVLSEKNVGGNIFLHHTHEKVLKALKQTDFLCPKYHVVVANPPYMGGKGMNGRLTAWAKDNYPNSKTDLFAMFIERNLDLARVQGDVAMITMQSWMFLSSFTKLRENILNSSTIVSMAHLGSHAFDSIGGEVVQTTAFIIKCEHHSAHKGAYLRLVDGVSEAAKQKDFKENRVNGLLKFAASAEDFGKIPGTPIAYWLSSKLFKIFNNSFSLDKYCESGGRIKTHNNDTYMRFHWEVDRKATNSDDSQWNLYENGGEAFKWYGNVINVVDWRLESKGFYQSHGGLTNERFWKKEGITWNNIGKSGFRYKSTKTEYSSVSPTAFPNEKGNLYFILGLLNTKFSFETINIINPSLSNTIGDIFKLPVIVEISESHKVINFVQDCIAIAVNGWNSREDSWDFTSLPLLHPDYRQPTLKATYQKLRTQWQEMTLKMQRLEEENNRIFIEAYGLQDELTPDIPLNEVTLTCNPHYRYGGNKNDEELESLLLADSMREFISYAVGCMFGRYALDKPGLILANQGETIEDYLRQIPDPTFPADDDNVIPLLDGDWFTDDITERFRKFLRVTFGEEHYEENLAFIENAIGKDIRKFFLKDFYADHVKRYKKRPIYWMFSSPKGSFNALIYMHRYRPDTVSVILNDYLREFKTKLLARKEHMEQISISASAIQSEKTNALKEIEKLKKLLDELETWEHDVLYPLASRRIEIDLDDGLKVNYNKFGKALKKVPGLSK